MFPGGRSQGPLGQREYIDILVKDENTTYAIELKYKTKELDAVFNNEEFHLLDQGARDSGRYDFVKDIGRMERFVESRASAIGWAILLTNDDNYWRETRHFGTTDAMFHIHENRTLNGELRWSEATGARTMEGRENSLILKGSHPIQWVDYSEVEGQGAGRFRYVLLELRTSY